MDISEEMIVDKVKLRLYDLTREKLIDTEDASIKLSDRKPIKIKDFPVSFDAKATFRYRNYSQSYLLVIKRMVTPNRIGELLSFPEKAPLPILLLSEYISKSSKADFEKRQISYIETNGNMHLISDQFLINVSGKKSNRGKVTSGTKTKKNYYIFLLEAIVNDPKLLNQSYGKIAKNIDASKTTVYNLFNKYIDDLILERVEHDELRIKDFEKLRSSIEEYYASLNNELSKDLLIKLNYSKESSGE